MKRSAEAAWERAMKVQEVILRAIAKQITWWQAAEIIGISDRQLRRWQRRYEEHGYTGLIDRRRGRVSERQVPLTTVEEVLRLYKEQHEVEGRFRFLKSPYFVGPLFLHSPRRVEAFAYVMLLALLLYSAFEHVIRTKMKQEQEPLILPGDRKSWKPTGSSVMDMFDTVLTSAIEVDGQIHRVITSRPYPQRDRVLAFFEWDTGIYTEQVFKG